MIHAVPAGAGFQQSTGQMVRKIDERSR